MILEVMKYWGWVKVEMVKGKEKERIEEVEGWVVMWKGREVWDRGVKRVDGV